MVKGLCVLFYFIGWQASAVYQRESELLVNSCSLLNYDRMSGPDQIFLGWRETQAEGAARGRAGKDNLITHAHTSTFTQEDRVKSNIS